MKNRIIKNLGLSIVLSLVTVGCSSSSDDNTESGIDGVKSVSFEIKPDTELSAVATGTTLSGKKEYLVTRSRTASFDKAGQMASVTIDQSVLYPGSILQGESFMNGVYDPLVLSNPFKPVTLFFTCNGSYSAKKEGVLPKGSDILTAKNSLVRENASNIATTYMPANYTFESEQVTTEESFKKISSVHAKANFLSIAKASFGYDKTTAWSNNKSYVVCKMKQTVYTAAIDPKYITDWIDGTISASQCGLYEPVYISSVDYGRVAYIMIETSNSTSSVNSSISASVSVAFKSFGGSVDYSTSTELKKLFDSKKVTVSILGGKSDVMVTDYKTFLDYMNPVQSNSVSYSAPVGYTVRRLKDNTTVRLATYYQDSYKEFR